MRNVCIGLLMNGLDTARRKESIGCDIVVVGRKGIDDKGEVNNFADRLVRTTFDSYDSIRSYVNLSLFAVGCPL